MTNTPEYGIWQGIKGRCWYSGATGYEWYGARGIDLCERWVNFERFYNDMGPRPSPHHSIDRIDNDKGYYPENCRWATPQEQGNNTRGNRYIAIEGVKRTVSEWAREYGISRGLIADRLYRGWDEVKAVTTPVIKKSRPSEETKHKMALKATGRVWSNERRLAHGLAQKQRFARERVTGSI